jgi:hypothetical protein
MWAIASYLDTGAIELAPQRSLRRPAVRFAQLETLRLLQWS